MNGKALTQPKKSAAGALCRLRPLERHGLRSLIDKLGSRLDRRCNLDDLLDAAAACWTAWRITEGEAVRIPEQPAKDARGLRMEIWR
jgi:predicted RNase H-like nuclease